LKFDTIEQNRRIGAAVIAMWKAVGVAALADNGGAQAIDRDARTQNYDAIRWTWFAPYDDASSFLALVESGDTTNRSTFSDTKLDELLSMSRETDNTTYRRSLLEQAEKRALDEQAVIPVYFLGNRRLVSPRVMGWRENARAINLTRHLWFAP
jgi:oligopeptide transport system substrate-binding protein